MSLLANTLCLLLFFSSSVLRVAQGSSRGSLGRKNGATTFPPSLLGDDGICASSVVIHGYKCQELQVTTADGYILSVQRIPEGRSGNGNNQTKQPVILQHGILVDGAQWLLNGPEQNLPLILADNGFDVWISNTRGTRFSRRHTSLDPSSKAYWDWSWDELASYDVPAVVEYVSSQTGQKPHYVGHSLFIRIFGISEFVPKGIPVQAFLKLVCTHPGVDCYDLLPVITGKNCCLNSSTIELLLKNAPQSTASKNLVHLAQTIRSGVLAKYNYVRPDYNFMHYGEASPPVYNLSNIPHDLPLFLSYGARDALSDVVDVQTLLDSLKSHDADKLSVHFIKDYAHLDFVMGVNAKDVVYNAVISFFNRQFN
ncbi:triacylglycerol lipase 2 isoform X2 [Arachis duranensis]|uniref:Lipase n=1 Tax=Arachis duranensis TaxID=130453 RepID=A0A9C6TB77_ARADU|nr:triacylglycerol lipase 2 isoform X2 [Arachis duranensis]